MGGHAELQLPSSNSNADALGASRQESIAIPAELEESLSSGGLLLPHHRPQFSVCNN